MVYLRQEGRRDQQQKRSRSVIRPVFSVLPRAR